MADNHTTLHTHKSKLIFTSVHSLQENNDEQTCQRILQQAAVLLNEQWERGGSVSDYKNKLTDNNDNSTRCYGRLPQSYLLYFENPKLVVVGHGRLTECCELEGNGKAVAATYIVIHPDFRGQGYGTTLMQELEEQAKRLTYHYMYLWTTSAVHFYEKLDYDKTCRVSLHSACLKTLNAPQVGKLEAMLRGKKCQQGAGTAKQKQAETVMLPPDSKPTDADVWLRKRLLECIPGFQLYSKDERRQELKEFIKKHNNQSSKKWRYLAHSNVPWQSQVGPSCGLACLRMLREYFSPAIHPETEQQPSPSLLLEAKKRGFTRDGEMFDVRNLQTMAEWWCVEHNFTTSLVSSSALSIPSLYQMLLNDSCVILSYDSRPITHLPCRSAGHHAHYGICVGMLIKCDDDDAEGKDITLAEMKEEPTLSSETTSCFLIVQQSLSPEWVIAPYQDFVDSNRQLSEIDAKFSPSGSSTRMNLRGWSLVCTGGIES